MLAKFSPETGFTSLIRFGETWQEKRHSRLSDLPIATISGSGGYDGQFYAQIALDPLLRGSELEHVIDAPAYRARRILLPGAAAVLGLGQPFGVVQIYALLNVACWFVLGWLLRGRVTGSPGIAYARWLGCMAGMGALESVRQSLTDLPALLLLFLAIRSYESARPARSTAWLALGHLAKETNLLGSLALWVAPGRRLMAGNIRPLVHVALATLPLVLWMAYVRFRFAEAAPASGGLGNLTWPLGGLITHLIACFQSLMHGGFDSRHTFGLLGGLGLALQAAVLWHHRQPHSAWWRIGAVYSALFLFLSSWVWSGYWAACRVVLPMTIAFNLLLPKGRGFWPLWIGGNLTILHAVWRFL